MNYLPAILGIGILLILLCAGAYIDPDLRLVCDKAGARNTCHVELAGF